MNFSKLKISIHRLISQKSKTTKTNKNSEVIKITSDEVKINSDNTKVMKKYSEFIDWHNQMLKEVGLNCQISRYPPNTNIKKNNGDIDVVFIKRKK